MNNGNYGLIHDLLQSLMSSVQWTPCFINGATSSCEHSRWLKRVIIQISVYPQEGGPLVQTEARWSSVLSHLAAHKRTAAAKQTQNSFKRDGWSQERSSTHDEALCVQLLMSFWTIHGEKLQKKRYKQLKKRNHLSVCCCDDKRNCTVIPLPQMIPLQLAVTCKWTRVPAGIR